MLHRCSPNKLIVDDRSTDDSSGESSEPLPVLRPGASSHLGAAQRLRVPVDDYTPEEG